MNLGCAVEISQALCIIRPQVDGIPSPWGLLSGTGHSPVPMERLPRGAKRIAPGPESSGPVAGNPETQIGAAGWLRLCCAVMGTAGPGCLSCAYQMGLLCLALSRWRPRQRVEAFPATPGPYLAISAGTKRNSACTHAGQRCGISPSHSPRARFPPLGYLGWAVGEEEPQSGGLSAGLLALCWPAGHRHCLPGPERSRSFPGSCQSLPSQPEGAALGPWLGSRHLHMWWGDVEPAHSPASCTGQGSRPCWATGCGALSTTHRTWRMEPELFGTSLSPPLSHGYRAG